MLRLRFLEICLGEISGDTRRLNLSLAPIFAAIASIFAALDYELQPHDSDEYNKQDVDDAACKNNAKEDFSRVIADHWVHCSVLILEQKVATCEDDSLIEDGDHVHRAFLKGLHAYVEGQRDQVGRDKELYLKPLLIQNEHCHEEQSHSANVEQETAEHGAALILFTVLDERRVLLELAPLKQITAFDAFLTLLIIIFQNQLDLSLLLSRIFFPFQLIDR